MIPFYIIKTEKFNYQLDDYTENSSVQITDNDTDADPQTQFTYDPTEIFDGFKTYELKTESKAKIRGRAYGKQDPFLSFIKINSSKMYYNYDEKILILSSPKEDVNLFQKAFSTKAHNNEIQLITNEVDFQKIITSAYSYGVQRVWFGKINDTRLKNEALYGNELEASTRYNELLQSGAVITNITISLKYRTTLIDVMITKNLGIILNSTKDFINTKERLNFIMYVYENIIKSSLK